ncbi:MAG TPA: DUF4389 domain-containing protein [Capillimicrobium sp.]|jgi:hypothetical protein
MYPVQYEADYVEERSRLSTFFRYFMVIPAAIVTMVYGIGAYFAVIAAWFAIVFTGRYPEGLYNFIAGFVRNSTRVSSYMYLVTDAYPPFNGQPDDAYPVRVHIGPPKAEYSRAKAFFRLILAIPAMIIVYALQILAGIMAFLGWFAILFTGKMPKSFQDLLDLSMRYMTRANAYYFLITEEYPPINDPAQIEQPPRTPAISG